MKYKYYKIFFVCLILSFFLACKSDQTDWSSPKKIYGLLCECKNSKDMTIDEAASDHLKSLGIKNVSNDKVTKYIAENTDEFLKFIEDNFQADPIYTTSLQNVLDTLNYHNADLVTQGNLGQLFSVKSKYPACVAVMSYITQ